MLNFASYLESNATVYGDKTAVICGPARISYTQLNQASNQIASLLQEDAGIKPGDRVALSCPNVPMFPMVYFGILKAGGVVVPLNVLLKRGEITYHLNDSGASAYLCFEGSAELPMAQEGCAGFDEAPECKRFYPIAATDAASLENHPTLQTLLSKIKPQFDIVQTQTDDTAVILYTSGTTGQPKGAELTHASILLNALAGRDLLCGEPQDIQLICLPLFHSFGQVVQMVNTVITGATQVLVPRFEPGLVWRLLQDENVTIFAGVPTMFWALLNYEHLDQVDTAKVAATLKVAGSGGAALPVEIMNQFEEKFNVPILEGYGLSETSPVTTFTRMGIARKPGAVGIPITGVEVKIVDPEDNEVPVGEQGEIVIRGHNVMKGYFRKPEATAKAMRGGWFHSGDVGKKDEDGYFYIVDRVKDMIIRGGFNVYPRELEETLLQHPSVSLCAVIGIPHDSLGEEVMAVVVPKAGETIDPEEVVAWCKACMAAYKYPRTVKVQDALPMTATGKILKRELRRQILAD